MGEEVGEDVRVASNVLVNVFVDVCVRVGGIVPEEVNVGLIQPLTLVIKFNSGQGKKPL